MSQISHPHNRGMRWSICFKSCCCALRWWNWSCTEFGGKKIGRWCEDSILQQNKEQQDKRKFTHMNMWVQYRGWEYFTEAPDTWLWYCDMGRYVVPNAVVLMNFCCCISCARAIFDGIPGFVVLHVMFEILSMIYCISTVISVQISWLWAKRSAEFAFARTYRAPCSPKAGILLSMVLLTSLT